MIRTRRSDERWAMFDDDSIAQQASLVAGLILLIVLVAVALLSP